MGVPATNGQCNRRSDRRVWSAGGGVGLLLCVDRVLQGVHMTDTGRTRAVAHGATTFLQYNPYGFMDIPHYTSSLLHVGKHRTAYITDPLSLLVT